MQRPPRPRCLSLLCFLPIKEQSLYGAPGPRFKAQSRESGEPGASTAQGEESAGRLVNITDVLWHLSLCNVSNSYFTAVLVAVVAFILMKSFIN